MPRMMSGPDKLVPLPEAVSYHVHDGDLVFVGGFGQGVPFAAGREVIRQGRRNLALCRTGADILFDILVAAGCVSRVKFGWYGNPGIGLSHVLRRAVADGNLTVEETSYFGLLLGLHAARLGVPFLPARILLDGDIPAHAPCLSQVVCPFTGETLSAVAAIRPDVALIHAQQADAAGNVQLWGIKGDTVEGAEASRRVICTVERIVPSDVIAESPSHTVLSASMVSAVALALMGAYPSYVEGFYGRDDAAYRAFEELSRKQNLLTDYINTAVNAFASQEGFVENMQAGRDSDV
jgi:glutaconate CoA-transferase subunit A